MRTFKQHRFGPYGPVCGTRDGVNAVDMDPPEITCRRCRPVEVQWWEHPKVERRNGRVFIVIEERPF